MKRLFILAFMALPIIAMAQKKQFTLDDLIPGGTTYYRTSYPQTKYLDWCVNTCIELGVDDCKDVRPSGSTIIITLDQVNTLLQLQGRKKIQHLLNASFPSKDLPVMLINSGLQYTLINLDQNAIVWAADLPAEAANIDLHPISLSMAFTGDHNLYVRRADGKIKRITKDGSADIVYGESVHRNEFGIEKGTFWNPQGTLLAFYRMDQSMVSKYPQVNITPYDASQVYAAKDSASIDSRCATLEPDAYPMAGEVSHKVSVGVYNTSTGETIYLETGDPTDRYFTNISWSPDGSLIYLIEVNRDQTHGTLDEYSATTGKKLRTILTEHNDKYFEPMHPIQFLPWDPTKFVYQTRKDGYNHIYVHSIKDGKLVKQLTKGEYEVIDLIGFNPRTKQVIYSSNEADPLQCNIYKVDMKGRRTLMGNSTGWHHAKLSADGEHFIDNYSSPIIPRHIDIVDVNDDEVFNVLSASDPWAAFDVPQIKVGSIKAADGVTDLYYRLILPTGFDPNKKYPAITYVYGGPHAHNVDATFHWGARGWDIWMAQRGYVMFCIDNRGSEHRGLDFEQATFRNLGVEEMKDQLQGIEYLKTLPYVDASRLGVHGWSFGGFMTTSLMTTYPDVFKVGVAGGPVIDWKFYEVMYGERYMDTPQTNPEGYRNTSLLNKAGNLKGRLMVIYGGNDPTCVPQHTLSFIRACIDAGTYPDLFTYPGDGHNMSGTDRVHLHHTITRYFDDHLK